MISSSMATRLYFVIGDVSGKGVPASLFMAIARSLFRTLAQQVTSPAEIMTKMNHSIAENNEANMFITLIIGILDLKTGSLRFCNAGHNPPVIIGVDGKSTLLQSKIQLFVGIHEIWNTPTKKLFLRKVPGSSSIQMELTEAENTSKELYGEDRLLSTLAPLASCDIRIVVDTVIRSIASHVQEAEASDDMTILLIHYEPNITKV